MKGLIAEKIFTDEITAKRIRMIDQATGEIYCTWIENGEWQKVKGECNVIDKTMETAKAQMMVPGTSSKLVRKGRSFYLLLIGIFAILQR